MSCYKKTVSFQKKILAYILSISIILLSNSYAIAGDPMENDTNKKIKLNAPFTLYYLKIHPVLKSDLQDKIEDYSLSGLDNLPESISIEDIIGFKVSFCAIPVSFNIIRNEANLTEAKLANNIIESIVGDYSHDYTLLRYNIFEECIDFIIYKNQTESKPYLFTVDKSHLDKFFTYYNNKITIDDNLYKNKSLISTQREYGLFGEELEKLGIGICLTGAILFVGGFLLTSMFSPEHFSKAAATFLSVKLLLLLVAVEGMGIGTYGKGNSLIRDFESNYNTANDMSYEFLTRGVTLKHRIDNQKASESKNKIDKYQWLLLSSRFHTLASNNPNDVIRHADIFLRYVLNLEQITVFNNEETYKGVISSLSVSEWGDELLRIQEGFSKRGVSLKLDAYIDKNGHVTIYDPEKVDGGILMDIPSSQK